MSDEGLDNLFKKGLSGRNVKFNMASWRAMEQMLPPAPKAAAFSMGTAASVIGVLLLISVSIFIWTSSDSTGILEVAGSGYSINTTHSENGLNNIAENAYSESGFRNEISSDENRISPINQAGQVNLANQANQANQNGESLTNKDVVLVSNQASANSIKEGSSSNEVNTSNSSNRGGASSSARSKAQSKSSNNQFFAQNAGFKSMTRTSSTSHIDGREMEMKESKITFGNNAFTQIEGLGELSSLTNKEDETILFANVDENNLPTVDKNVIGFIGGINVNKSLVENPSTGISGSEFFGLTYQRYLKGGLSLKTNLLYSARNEVNTRKAYAIKTYGFGSKTEQTTVESQRLIYLELPVMVNYGFGNHNVMGGASFSYLVSSLNKVTTNYTSVTDGDSSIEKSEWGYKNGFKSYDVALVAGYEYNVNPKLNVGMRLNYGLIDVTNNTYFGVDSFDNNVQVRVYLTFSPFQF